MHIEREPENFNGWCNRCDFYGRLFITGNRLFVVSSSSLEVGTCIDTMEQDGDDYHGGQ